MHMKRRNCQSGRTSCWVIGGIGCLGLLIISVIAGFFLWRAFEGTFGNIIESAREIESVFEPRYEEVVDAIREYLQDNNGKYPPDLKALVPKYLQADALEPVVLSDGKQIKFVYKPPKPNDPPDTVVLEHSPPLVMTMEVFGEQVEMRITYQFRKDGSVVQKQEQVSSSGERRIRVRPQRN